MQETSLAGIIMATRLEAEPFIQAFNLKEIGDQPFPIYARNDIILTISGIGKANAAMATAYTCIKFYPEWILNLGAAGATESSQELGSIYHIERTVEPDRPDLETNTPYVQFPDLLPGFKKAALATQDKAINDLKAFREIAPIADLVDMEGASIVQVCRKFGKRCLLFKFVSDTPVHVSQGDMIIDHIKKYSESFCDFISNSVVPVLKKEA